VQQQVAAGHLVWTVYEACGFGYTLHHQLTPAGAHSRVIGPLVLSPGRHRKNDRLDSRQLCLRLSRYLDGHYEDLPIIRVPSRAEQQRRETGRQREFWKKQVRQWENHGRALRLEHEHQSLPYRGWGPRHWKKLNPPLSNLVAAYLEPLRQQILHAQEQLEKLTTQIEARLAAEKIPKGLGELTLALADAEVCDWSRFADRKAPASFTGSCPSEYSSGGVQRTGHIDRHGNKRLRTLWVEAVWRLGRWQPTWHAWRKMMALPAGAHLTKKRVVALARQLAVDLWRVRTGRCSWAELGLLNLV
jgi:transposase